MSLSKAEYEAFCPDQCIEPKAAPSNLCVYAAEEHNAQFGLFRDLAEPRYAKSPEPKSGALIGPLENGAGSPGEGEEGIVSGTWAVTAA